MQILLKCKYLIFYIFKKTKEIQNVQISENFIQIIVYYNLCF